MGSTRVGAGLAVTVLAGTATAAAGPIVFVGLMVPHVARRLAGPLTGWVLVYSGVAGAVLLITADVAGRLLIWPAEAPAGLVTALIGAPILILLAQNRRMAR